MISRFLDQARYRFLKQIPTDRPFIFGIGLSKTGTTSLNHALEVLGYKAFHMPPITQTTENKINFAPPWWIWKYDALTDLSAAVLFRTLDAQFPNARFIYTTRDTEKWLASCQRHFSPELAAMRRVQGNDWMNTLCDAFYGSHLFDEPQYRRAYETHDAAVKKHFQGRSDILEYDLTAGEGWAPLCEFLGHSVPDLAFPRTNVARSA